MVDDVPLYVILSGSASTGALGTSFCGVVANRSFRVSLGRAISSTPSGARQQPSQAQPKPLLSVEHGRSATASHVFRPHGAAHGSSTSLVLNVSGATEARSTSIC